MTAFLVGTVWTGTLAQNLAAGIIAERVVIEKAARTLTVYSGGQLLKTYRIALGPKRQRSERT